MGLVCEVPGGYTGLAPDGTRLFTHGVDPIPAPRASLAVTLPDVGVACVPASEPHIRVLYATPSNVPVATMQIAPVRREVITASVLNANAIVYANAQQHGSDIRWKTLCDEDGDPLVEDVRLNQRIGDVDFFSLSWELMERGYGNADEKVLVFYDGSVSCGSCGGISFVPGWDEASPLNANNFGWWSYSAVFIGNYGATAVWPIDEVALHEETHAMGGVQLSAPNTSGGFHCNDGWDIMCYSDGGSSSAYAETCSYAGASYVGLSQPYDCGSDDYFHPSPAPGSYLDTHWNVGAAYNRFLARA